MSCFQFKAPCCCWICLIFLIWYIQKRLLFRKFEIFYLFLNSLFSTFLGRSWSWFMVFKPSILGSNPSILNSATCKLASLRALFQRTYVCFIILFYLFLITISAELMVLPINPRSKKSHILSIVSGNLQWK